MYSRRLERTFKKHPAWRAPLERIIDFIGQPSSRTTIDPTVLAVELEMRPAETLAFLRVLQESGLGRIRLRVVDDSGSEVSRYDALDQIPRVVRSQFGDVTRVFPENVEVVFEPARTEP